MENKVRINAAVGMFIYVVYAVIYLVALYLCVDAKAGFGPWHSMYNMGPPFFADTVVMLVRVVIRGGILILLLFMAKEKSRNIWGEIALLAVLDLNAVTYFISATMIKNVFKSGMSNFMYRMSISRNVQIFSAIYLLEGISFTFFTLAIVWSIIRKRYFIAEQVKGRAQSEPYPDEYSDDVVFDELSDYKE